MSATIRRIGGTPVMDDSGKKPLKNADGSIKQTGGHEYVLEMMPAETSFMIQIRLLRIMGEPLFKLLILGAGEDAGLGGVLLALKSNPDAMGAVIGMLTQRMDPADMLSIAKTVFESVRIKGDKSGKPIVFAEWFLGKPLLIWQVLIEALKENYGSVLKGVASPSPASGAAPA